MSENDNSIYSKGLIFTIVALVVILAGTIATVFVPMMTDAMHPKLDTVQENPYTPLQLAGRVIYQKEGCINCHSQTVRPLKADVVRYGEISQPGESAFEQPFLWGSKRTGPDLARVGGVYSDEWQKAHMLNPQHFFPKSNMPKYPWLAEKTLNPEVIEKHAKALGLKYTQDDIDALKDMTELDALVAYLQQLGTYVENTHAILADEEAFADATNPFIDNQEKIARGEEIYNLLCIGCHAENGKGSAEGYDLTSQTFAEALPDYTDGMIFTTIANGIPGVMPNHIKIMTKDDIWSLSAYVKSLANKEGGN